MLSYVVPDAQTHHHHHQGRLGNIKDFYISNEHIRGVDFVLCCWLEPGSLDGGVSFEA